MSSIYNDDSLTLHTDLYQINMMKTYWETGVYEKKAIFEAYFRRRTKSRIIMGIRRWWETNLRIREPLNEPHRTTQSESKS